MPKKSIIKSGDRFGLLTVIREVEPNRWGPRHIYRKFLCQCDCGNFRNVVLSNLRKAKSCGCVSKNALAEHNKSKRTKLSEDTKFGRLSFVRNEVNVGKGHKALFRCECGTVKSYFVSSVIRGRTKSCGCYRDDVAGKQNLLHGMKGTKTYEAWMSMKARCKASNAESRPRYAGRGIEVCERWNDFLNFFSDMGVRPENTTLHRLDNDKGYFHGNCIWADSHTQNNCKSNTRYVTLKGVTKPLMTWCRDLGITKASLVYRLAKWGDDHDRIMRRKVKV